MVAALCPGKARKENKEYDQYLAPALAAPCGWSVAGVARTKKEKKGKSRRERKPGKRARKRE